MDNRRGPRDQYRERSDRNDERHNSRQMSGDSGSHQHGQYSQDYRQPGGGYDESRFGQAGERDEWSAGDEFGYGHETRRPGDRALFDEMPGRGEGGRYEWATRPAFGGNDYRNDVFRDHRGYGGRSMAEGRSGSGRGREHDQGGRDFWDKASDEVSSWFGDRDAERRREMDKHRGRGPKNYTRSDERIKEDVNDRLTEDGWLDATDIDVEVVNREVTLTGQVSSRSAKRRAEDVAEDVSGVAHVQNNLRVSETHGESGEQGGNSDRSSSFAAMRRSVSD